jgi:hypothetical protein
MKMSILLKILITIMVSGLLLSGCGSGGSSGEICYGDCSNTGSGDDGGGSGGGGDDDDNDTGNGGGGTGLISANLIYDSLEENITDPRGMFNVVHDQIEADKLDNHSNGYAKQITYHSVPAGIATRLVPILHVETYPMISCTAIDSPPLCQEYARQSGDLSTDVINDGIYSAHISFNYGQVKECNEESGACDVTLIAWANTRYHNNTNPIPIDMFKRAFTDTEKYNGDTYAFGGQMKGILDDIEKSALSITLDTHTFYLEHNWSTYVNVNRTIQDYTNMLNHNNGSEIGLPQIAMYPSGSDGEGVTLSYGGAYYELKNIYEPFQSDKKNYSVNESDTSGPNYWMYDNGSGDYFSMITLCQRTVNATVGNATVEATNATYECEEGLGNITAYWSILGKDINMGW